MSKPVKLTFVRDRCRCLLEGENTCVTVLEVVKLLCYVFVWCLTRGTVRRMYAFDRTLRLGWSRCGTEAGCGLRKTMPITSLLARTLLSSTGETLSLRALTSLWLIVFFFHFWHFMMQIKRVIKLLYVLPYKLIHMKAEPLLLQQKFGHSWLAENVNCRLLSLLQSTQCGAQLQLTAYKLSLIWLNHGLVTSKGPGFNETSTQYTADTQSYQEMSSNTIWRATLYYCHDDTLCVNL